jgi:amino acid transporter
MKTPVQESRGKELPRTMEFRDVFFLAIGGQAPILSMLTYTAAVLIIVGQFSPISDLIGTIIVLFNGLVIFFLSRRFTSTGGYFTYAFYGLSKRLGLETGLLYTFYSVLYGSAYVAGSVFIINYILGIPVLLAFLVSIVPAAIFLILGIKPSAKYALVSASIEVSVLVLIFIVSMISAHLRLYNPLDHIPSPKFLFLSILYAIGIPTGYGTMVPASGEVKKAEVNVGRAAILVILVGGGLMALVLYGMVDASLVSGNVGFATSSNVSVILFIKHLLGPVGIPVILITAISDGILATLSFMVASSRNLFAMGLKGVLPSPLSYLRKNSPLLAGLATIVLYAAIVLPLLSVMGSFNAFLLLGALAGMGNLFIHISANFSLIKINLDAMIRKGSEIVVASVAQFSSFVIIVYSIFVTKPMIAITFLAFIVAAFAYTEGLGFTGYGKKALD